MRVLVQRVKEAKVEVEGEETGKIGKGLLAFLGIHKEDRPEQTVWMVNKLLQMRIFSDEQGKMNKSVIEVKGEVLLVSQFTLYGDCSNGRRPSFTNASSGPTAQAIYKKFVDEVKEIAGKVEEGVFGALMEVSLINDGPVTLLIDDANKKKKF